MSIQGSSFGTLLRYRREEAHLSRATLAKLTKLSEATIKFIETDRTTPSRMTLLALQSVAALGLQDEEMPTEFRAFRRNMLRQQDTLRRVLDRQYQSTELMIRESVLTEILEYVCAQLFRIKQRKDELTPDSQGAESVAEQSVEPAQPSPQPAQQTTPIGPVESR
jgi:transcriptional regulator with XRE-family HTH domain